MTTEQDTLIDIDQIPPPPEGAVFKLLKVEKVALPHPYGITPKHLQPGRMILDGNAIEDAERYHGAECFICVEGVKRHRGGSVLRYSEHTNDPTLFIGIPALEGGRPLHSLGDIPGLHQYLLDVKDPCEGLGIKGFAFPTLTELPPIKLVPSTEELEAAPEEDTQA